MGGDALRGAIEAHDGQADLVPGFGEGSLHAAAAAEQRSGKVDGRVDAQVSELCAHTSRIKRLRATGYAKGMKVLTSRVDAGAPLAPR